MNFQSLDFCCAKGRKLSRGSIQNTSYHLYSESCSCTYSSFYLHSCWQRSLSDTFDSHVIKAWIVVAARKCWKSVNSKCGSHQTWKKTNWTLSGKYLSHCACKKEHHVTMIHCYMLISSECMETTQAKPYYLCTTTLKRRGAGCAIKAHIRCPRTYKGHFGPCADCMPSITLSVGPSMSPSYFIISAITKFSKPTISGFFPTLCDTTWTFLVWFMFQETNDGENISEALSFVNDKCRDLYETPAKWKYWLWLFSSDEKCYLGEKCHYCYESTVHTSQA